jgi:hypothetical protein
LVDACITFTKYCSHLFKQAHRFGDVNMQTCGPDPSLLATTTVTKIGWEYVWNHCGISTYCTLYSFSSCVNFLDIGRKWGSYNSEVEIKHKIWLKIIFIIFLYSFS